MSERRQRFALGTFVFITLLMMGGLVIVFGSAGQWFKQSNTYTIDFTDAPGISNGAPVRKSGVKVGVVSRIDLDNETGLVRVTVKLDPKFTPRTSDEPLISKGLITGDTSIDFVPKTGDRKVEGMPIPPGSRMVGVAPLNTRALVTSASDIIPEAMRSVEQIRKSLEAVEKLSPQVESTLKEFGELARAGREFIPELRKTNDAIRDFFVGDDEPPVAANPARIEQVGFQAQQPAKQQPKKTGGQQDLKGSLKELKELGPEIRKTSEEMRFFLRSANFWTDEIGVMLLKNEPRVAKAIDSITATSDSLNKTLSPENQKNIAATLKNVESATAKLDRLTTTAEELMKDGKTTLKTINGTLAKADLAMDDIRQVTKPLAESMPRLIKNVDLGVEQFTRTLVDVNQLVGAIGKAEGTFQKFISDPSLYNNINAATVSAAKLMPRLEQILKDVEVFADKIARHPESLGIGGAVRPSSGIKESPASPGFRPMP